VRISPPLPRSHRPGRASARPRPAAAQRHAIETGNLDEAVDTSRTVRRGGRVVRKHLRWSASAEADRNAAATDRQRAASDRCDAGLDELTGIYRRGTGELALTHEIDRSRRSGLSLVIAVIDIDDLKAVNDNQGHAAGDALLRDMASAITSTLRSYDVTVRWGGDEFVCALSDLTIAAASERVAEIQRALEAPGRGPGSARPPRSKGTTPRCPHRPRRRRPLPRQDHPRHLSSRSSVPADGHVDVGSPSAKVDANGRPVQASHGAGHLRKDARVVRTAIVSTYPPRACGIGAFAADVRSALLGLDEIDRVEKVVIVNEPSSRSGPG
jgi:GGDEF domain-containing protein